MSEKPTSSRREARRKPAADAGTFGVNLRTDAGYNWITRDYSLGIWLRPSELRRAGPIVSSELAGLPSEEE